MHELLDALAPGARVLDIGSGAGSFETNGARFTAVRVDLETPARETERFVQADAARLPFADGSFDLIVSNHSLEHFADLEGALGEVGRVLKPGGALYIAVPDASTFSDRLYRWLSEGGGHVNPFTSADELSRKIARATGKRHVATRTLCSSLACLNRRNRRSWAPRRLIPLGGGTQPSLVLMTYLLRLVDRFLGTRTSVYGWAFYFGEIGAAVDRETWTNVCVRCGAGHPSGRLRQARLVKRKWGMVPAYRCPGCATLNFFTDDRDYRFAV